MEDGFLDFSTSINPYQPDWKREVFLKAERNSTRYTYFEDLDRELGELVGEDVAITAGATEGIYLSLIFLKNLDMERIIIPNPTYSEYERVSRIFGCRVVKAKVNPQDLAEKVRKNSAVFFCNPNNPDGKYFSPKELRSLIKAVEDSNSILIIDEAFKDFVKGFESPDGDNIIKIRTFTKSYGMPGIRVGYITGFSSEFQALRMPWSIGSVGYAFIEKIIEDGFDFLRNTMPKIWKEKERIEKALGVKSDANYFLMKFDVDLLKSKKILVRDCRSFGLNSLIRFSVRKPEENTRLIEAIKSLSAE
jgi:histidinol-phosphate aminotransferase